MEFSENYLDNMLGSAIEFYNHNSIQQEQEIPQSLENPNQAINIFTSCLKNEAHRSFQQTTVSKEPILYTVNLDSENPGIVVEVDKKESKIKIYNKTNCSQAKPKKKRKNYKNLEAVQQDADKELQKLITHQTEIAQKEDFKSNQKIINQSEKELKKLNNQLSKLTSHKEELEQQISQIDPQQINSKANQKIIQKKNKISDQSSSLSNDIDDCKQKLTPYQEKVSQYQQIQELKKIEKQARKQQKLEQKQQKLEQQQKLSQEQVTETNSDNSGQPTTNDTPLTGSDPKDSNPPDNNLDTIEIHDPSTNSPAICESNLEVPAKVPKAKKKKKLNQIPKEEISDELFDILESYKNYQSETVLESKVTDLNQVKLYPSPIPFNRHLKALEDCNPNPLLLPILLYGNTSCYSEAVKIIHGPPGTGKTSRLIKELIQLLDKNPQEKILLCAPSNIGVLNLYQRAISFGIRGCLILSNNKIPSDCQLSNQKSKNNIVFTTISMRFGKLLDNIRFTKIIMDEASQCQEAWCWGLLRREVNQLIMAGDPYQLPSLVSETGEKLKYNRSLMERLMEIKVPAELLDVQRRMHPLIAQFSNQHYYNNQLKTDYHFDFKLPPIQIININGQEEKVNNSYHNLSEVEQLNQEYQLLKDIFKEVIVISPYQAQCNLIKQNNPEIPVHTIDSFQGKEAEAVLITTVRSGKTVGFWNDYRRLNVAMTRAKHILRIIGDISTWQLENGPLNQLYHFAVNNKLIK